jgi:hypothetical protein
MVKASNKAQQRRRLPRGSATSSNEKGKQQAVNVGHGPHFRTPVARAYADTIKQGCLDAYDAQVIEAGKKNPPCTLQLFVDIYRSNGNQWLTLEMVKGRRKNKKKSENKKKQQQKKNRKKAPPSSSSTSDHAPGSQELRSSLKEANEPGRPQGTNASKDADKELFIKMKNEIVSTWSDITKRPNVLLQAYIQQVQSQYGLDPIEYPVSIAMVHSRMRRNRIEVQGVLVF